MTTRRESITQLTAGLALGATAAMATASSQPTTIAPPTTNNNNAPAELAVVWTSADPDVAHRMALMYTHAAKQAGWFQTVRLIAWGPSQRILVGDKDLQAKVLAMAADGITLQACVVCANSYGIADRLRDLGFDVLPMGEPLTSLLKDPNVRVMTF